MNRGLDASPADGVRHSGCARATVTSATRALASRLAEPETLLPLLLIAPFLVEPPGSIARWSN